MVDVLDRDDTQKESGNSNPLIDPRRQDPHSKAAGYTSGSGGNTGSYTTSNPRDTGSYTTGSGSGPIDSRGWQPHSKPVGYTPESSGGLLDNSNHLADASTGTQGASAARQAMKLKQPTAENPSLAEQEANTWKTNLDSHKKGESPSLAQREKAATGKGAISSLRNAASALSGNPAAALKSVFTKRNSAIGGGIVTLLVGTVIGLSALGSLETPTVKANVLGYGNQVQNFARSTRNVTSSLEKLTEDWRKRKPGDPEADEADEVFGDTKAVEDKFAENNLNITFDDQGNPSTLSSVGGDTPLTIDLQAEDASEQFANALSTNPDFGTNISKALSLDTTYAQGDSTDELFANVIHVNTGDWLANDEPAQPSGDLNADATETIEKGMQADPPTLTPGDAAAAEQAAGVTAEEAKTTQVDSLGGEISTEAQQAAATAQANPGVDPATIVAKESGNTGPDQDLVGAEGQATENGGTPAELTTAIEDAAEGLTIQQGIAAAAAGVDPDIAAQTACEVKGALQFVANARNVLLAIELTRFAVRYLTEADHQEAGLESSQGQQLLLTYLHRPDSNGTTYLQTGGMQYAMGNTSATVSQADETNASVGQVAGGVLGTIDNIIDGIPFLFGSGSKKVCRIANNFGTIAAGAVVGVVADVFTGGASGEASAEATSLIKGLGIIALAIARPFLVELLAHLVIPAATGALTGALLGSGFGGLKSMLGSTKGMAPLTKQQAAMMTEAANLNHQQQLAQENTFQRYFSLNNSDSLLSRVAMAADINYGGGLSTALSTSVFGSLFSNIGSVFTHNPFTTPAYADSVGSSDQCEDPNYSNLATDPFCNPIVAYAPDVNLDQAQAYLQSHGDLDSNYQPSGDFASYISDCLSGRPNIVYTQIKQNANGGDSLTDPQCTDIDNGPIADSVTVTNNSDMYYAGLRNQKPSLLARLTGTKTAYALGAQTTGPATKYQVYVAMYGFLKDRQDMCTAINDSYENPAQCGG